MNGISHFYQVWSLDQPDWRCKIDEGLAGLEAVRWSPDSRHILSTAEFQVGVFINHSKFIHDS